MSVRGFAVEGIETTSARRRRMRCSISRSPPTGLTACRSSAWRARWRPRTGCRSNWGRRCLRQRTTASACRAGRSKTAPAVDGPADRHRHRRSRPVPPLRRRGRGRDGRPVSGLDAGAPAGCRHPSDQQHRRHHQLRAARAGPADARVRSREAGGRADSRADARAPAKRSGRSTASRATLSPDMLVIADAERAVAVAGVMGGADSEVTSATTAIVLESAYFNPLSVRRTSKKLGLKTEASMRFERGADPQTAGDRHGARGRAARDDWRRPRARRRSSIAIRARVEPGVAAAAPREDSRPARRRRSRTPTCDASSTSLGFVLRDAR